MDCFENERFYPDLIEHLFIYLDYFNKMHFMVRNTYIKRGAFFEVLEDFINS